MRRQRVNPRILDKNRVIEYHAGPERVRISEQDRDSQNEDRPFVRRLFRSSGRLSLGRGGRCLSDSLWVLIAFHVLPPRPLLPHTVICSFQYHIGKRLEPLQDDKLERLPMAW